MAKFQKTFFETGALEEKTRQLITATGLAAAVEKKLRNTLKWKANYNFHSFLVFLPISKNLRAGNGF